jgi:hypothetical protein
VTGVTRWSIPPEETKEVIYMEKPVERPFSRMLVLAALAVLVALVAAVSAFAVGGSGDTADNPASSPAQTQSVQDSQATPTPEQGQRSAPGGREDCPEKDGAGQDNGAGQGSSQPENQSTAPDTSTPAPEV